MNATNRLCHLTATIFLATLVSHFTRAEEPPKKQEANMWRQMIDGLANRNRAPKGVSLRGSVRKSPLFLENYDWNEQHRVLLAVRRLYEQTSEGLWEELLRNVDDKRYSLTLKDNSELYILCHTTVGSYCHGLAWDHLIRLSERHLPEQAN